MPDPVRIGPLRRTAATVGRVFKRIGYYSPDQRAVLVQSAVDLIRIDVSLKRRGFKETFKRTEKPHRLAARVRRMSVEHVAHIVDSAARNTVGLEKSCLRRSILLVWLLRSAGVECDLISGIGREDGDWRGHAWVEIDGRPIGQGRDLSTFAHMRDKLSRHQPSAGMPSANSPTGPSVK